MINIKVHTLGSSPETTTYKFNASRTEYSYDSIFSKLVETLGKSIATINEEDRSKIKDSILSVFDSEQNKVNGERTLEIVELISNNLVTHEKQMNKYMVEGFNKYIGWTSDINGNIMYLVRTGTRGNTWCNVDDICTYIRSHKIDGLYIIEHLSKYYYGSKDHGGALMYRIVDTDTGKWGDPITYLELATLTARNLYKKNQITADEGKRALRHIEFTETNKSYSYIQTVFDNSKDGWLFNLWCKSPEVTMEFPKTITNCPSTPAYSYIDLTDNYLCYGKTPDFDGWLEMMPEAARGPFMATLYASVKEDAHISQVIYLHGEGNDGKSEIFRAFEKAFGASMVGPVASKDMTSDFGTEGMIGKRILFCGDLQNGNFLNSNVVHAITGGDSLLVNRKYEKHISYKFDSILFVGANLPPEINMSLRNEARRLFYIPVSEPSEATMRKYCKYDETTGKIIRRKNGMPIYTNYDLSGSLVNEMPHILYKAKIEFEKYYGHKTLILPDSVFDYMLELCGSTQTDILDNFVNDAINVDENGTVSVMDISNAYIVYIHGLQARNKLSSYPFELRDLKRHLKATMGISPKHYTLNGTRKRAYKGISLKYETLEELHDVMYSSFEHGNKKTPHSPLSLPNVIAENF